MRDEEVVSNVCKVKVNLLPPPLSTHLTPRVCGGGGRRREEVSSVKAGRAANCE